MNSRMDRYNETNEEIVVEKTMTRSIKNKDLYNSVYSDEFSRARTNNNIRVIDSNNKDIDINKIKKYIDSLNANNEVKKKRVFQLNEENTEQKNNEEEIRDYDINSVIEKARQNRGVNYQEERYKKLHNTQFDILSELNINKEIIEDNEIEFNTNERTLIDLINTVTIHKDDMGLLDELTGGDENTEIIEPMKQTLLQTNEFKEDLKQEIIKEMEEKKQQEEIMKTKELVSIKEAQIKDNIDKSFYTNSMTFSKEDFEGFEELEKSVKKNNVLAIISLVLLFVAVIVTLFVISNYVFNLGLF